MQSFLLVYGPDFRSIPKWHYILCHIQSLSLVQYHLSSENSSCIQVFSKVGIITTHTS